MRSVLAAAVLFLLAACSNEAEGTNEAVATAAPAPVLGGVDLSRPMRLLGTEPFWGIDLTGDEIVYSGVDRPEERAPQPAPEVQGTVATLAATTTAGTDVAITLTATECSDGMSDRTYPLTALVEVDEETLMGCAAPTAAIMSAGESGRVVEEPEAQPAG